MSEIICKQAMEAYIRKNFFRDEDCWVIENAWEAAERAMQKKAIQKPVLEHKSSKLEVMKTDQEPTEATVEEILQKLYNMLLTQEELQFLKTEVKQRIKSLQKSKQVAKMRAAYLYSECDLEDDNKKEIFQWMNNARDSYRKTRNKLAKLEVIQNKLKKQLNS